MRDALYRSESRIPEKRDNDIAREKYAFACSATTTEERRFILQTRHRLSRVRYATVYMKSGTGRGAVNASRRCAFDLSARPRRRFAALFLFAREGALRGMQRA